MAGLDKKLTDLTELASPTDNAWIHVVEPSDISQSPEGSSFKVKKSNFGGLSDAPSDGETYGRKDGAWEIVSGNVLTTNTNITSSSLTTQDVSGFVSYINSLLVSFEVLANEIRTYTVTDTGQKFEILLRGRSFGLLEAPITTSDVLEIEKGSDNFHTVVFSGFMSVPDFTNWYAQTRNGQNILNPTYTAYGTITPSNSFSDDLNILPNNIIPFKHKVHSCFGHFYSNISGSIPVDFAVRTFVFPNGANMGLASAALNSTIVARRVITQTAGGSQPNVEFTGSEINSAYVGAKNSWCKLYFKNNFGATIGQFGFNITIVFQKVD